jgi:Xaa-Pro aminopeptidase
MSSVAERDSERIGRNRQALKDASLDAVVCALPMNVLLASGYWPVIGASLTIFTSEGETVLIVPEDEVQLAEHGWADRIISFSPASLTELSPTAAAVQKPLTQIIDKLKVGRIGFENGTVNEPVTYAAMNLYGAGMIDLLKAAAPACELIPSDTILERLRSTLTVTEIKRVKNACRIAQSSFAQGRLQIGLGSTETEIATAFRTGLSVFGDDITSGSRADGYAYCMSGENSYEAFAAFQISRSRRLSSGDLVLVHCNSYANGFWTDITRTYCMGEPTDRQLKMYEAVFAAREAALKTITPRVKASEVDRAARSVIEEYGFGKEFKHGLGHSVGFHAINHNAPPRLHPASPDILETRMVFNIEPAIYIKDFGGMRHCDMAAVTEHGAEILTPFQSHLESLILKI